MRKFALILFAFLAAAFSTHAQAPCLPQFFNDFEGGTSGNNVTVGQLETTSHGIGGTWVNIGAITWQTSGNRPLTDATGVLCGDSTNYAGGAGSLGIAETGTGTAVERALSFVWTGNSGLPAVSSSIWYCNNITPPTGATTYGDDIFLIGSTGGDYTNIQMLSSNGQTKFNLETAGMQQSAPSWGIINYSNGTGCGPGGTGWVNLQLLYNNLGSSCITKVGGTAAPCMKLRVYNYLGQPLGCSNSSIASSCADGITLAGPSTGANTPKNIIIGHLGNQDPGSGNQNYWDSLQGNFSGTFPIAQSCIPVSTGATDVQAAINNCSTGGYVDIPSGGSTWTTQVAAAPTGNLTVQGKTVCTGGCAVGSGGIGLAFTDNTNITLSNASGASFIVNGCSSSTVFCTINNLTLIDGVAQSNGQFVVLGTHGQVGFRVYNIHMQSALGSGVDSNFTNGYGLIDLWRTDNTAASGESTPFNFGGDFATHGAQNWTDTTNFGTNQAIILEDFQVNMSGCIAANSCTEGLFDAYFGAKMTIRHGIVNNLEIGGWHGTDSGFYRSGVGGEIYNLAVNNCPGTASDGLMNTRGGTLLLHDNTVTGTCGSIDLQYFRFLGQNHSPAWGTAKEGLNWTPISATPSNALSDVVTLNAPDWQASHAYTCSVSAPCIIGPLLNNAGTGVTGAGGYNYMATVSGTSGSTEPNPWNQTFGCAPATPSSCQQSDGSMTWLNIGGGTAAGPGGDGFVSNALADVPSTTGVRFFDTNWVGGSGGYPYRDQPGTIGGQTVFGNYEWNNSGAGLPSPVFTTDTATSGIIQSGRDYFLGISPAGYSAYTYPDPLAVTGGSPGIGFNPTNVIFGVQQVSQSSGSITIVITNTGSANLSISSFAMQSGGGSQFSVVSNTCGSPIAPNSTCNVLVNFTPTATGSYTDNLVVTDNAGAGTQLIPLSGQGLITINNPVMFTALPLPANPIILSLSPASAYVTSQGFSENGAAWTPSATIRILGSNFLNNSTTSFDGTPLTPTFVNSGELDVTLPASMVSLPQSLPMAHTITVANPVALLK